jgi:hypothetical protein
MIKKSKILSLLIIGALFSGALVLSAFTEPSASPSSTNSYVPINLGNEIQVRTGKLGIGDGDDPADTTLTRANTLYLAETFASENTTVRQNANFFGNVTVLGNAIIAGLVRVPEIEVCDTYFNDTDDNYGSSVLDKCGTSTAQLATTYPKFNNTNDQTFSMRVGLGINTNLGMGNCTQVTNSDCPSGYILSKYNSATTVSSCRRINPSVSPTSLSSC